MRIALDGMGGDMAPAAVVKGAVRALDQTGGGLRLVLVGDPQALKQELERLGVQSERISIQAASQVAGMDESPSQVLRRLTDSSIRVCFDLLKAGRVDAVVSAGNSGATMAVGSVVIGRLPEVDRPALAQVFPGVKGRTVLIDVGANVDCTPIMLLQFGYMGAVYAERVLGIAQPTVGLLSIGEEGGKGNSTVKAAHEYFKNSALNFVGNVEGRDIYGGLASVVVCDGFVGNVCLKLSEGMAESMRVLLAQDFSGSTLGRLGARMLKPALERFTQRFDYASYGGAPLLGLGGVTFICHGASNPEAIAQAVAAARDSVAGRLVEHLREGLAAYRGRLLGENGEPETPSGDTA